MSEVYDGLMEGLNEALAYAKGAKTGAIAHQIAVPLLNLGTWTQATDWPGASAARDDRAPACAGE